MSWLLESWVKFTSKPHFGILFAMNSARTQITLISCLIIIILKCCTNTRAWVQFRSRDVFSYSCGVLNNVWKFQRCPPILIFFCFFLVIFSIFLSKKIGFYPYFLRSKFVKCLIRFKSCVFQPMGVFLREGSGVLTRAVNRSGRLINRLFSRPADRLID